MESHVFRLPQSLPLLSCFVSLFPVALLSSFFCLQDIYAVSSCYFRHLCESEDFDLVCILNVQTLEVAPRLEGPKGFSAELFFVEDVYILPEIFSMEWNLEVFAGPQG